MLCEVMSDGNRRQPTLSAVTISACVMYCCTQRSIRFCTTLMSFHEMLLRRWRLRGAAPEEEVEEEEEAEEVEEDDDDDEDEDDDEEEEDDDDWSFPAAPAAPAAAAASVAAVAVAAAAAAAAAASSSTGAPRLVPLGEGEEEESAIGVTALRGTNTSLLYLTPAIPSTVSLKVTFL